MTRSGLLIISSDWLREEVRKAVEVWKKMNPGILERVKADVKQSRESQLRPTGMSDSGDLSLSARIPSDLLEILKWDPEQVMPDGSKLGVGIGVDHVREHEHDITDLILRECPEFKVSTLYGAPSARGWS